MEYRFTPEDCLNDNNGYMWRDYNSGLGWYDGHGAGTGSGDYGDATGCGFFDEGAGTISGCSRIGHVEDSDQWLTECLES